MSRTLHSWLRVERLEDRATPYSTSFSGGILTVTAQAGGEQVGVGASSDGTMHVNLDPIYINGSYLTANLVSKIRLVGGAGNDTLSVGNFMDQLNGKQITIDGAGGNDWIMADWTDSAARWTVLGGAGNDTILGSEAGDSIDGGAGNDLIYADKGNDTIKGGDGNDAIFGEQGDDSLLGDAGDDLVYGGEGKDTVRGGAGDDVLDGYDNREATWLATSGQVKTNDGDDLLYGDDGGDLIADVGQGNDSIYGGDKMDWLYGGDGNDLIRGEEGNDMLVGEAGNDDLDGGTQDDRYVFDAGWGRDTINDTGGAPVNTWYDGGDGILMRNAPSSLFNIKANGVDVADANGNTITVPNNNLEYLTGGAGDDVFNFDAQNVSSFKKYVIYGGLGSDSLDYHAVVPAVNVNLNGYLVNTPYLPETFYFSTTATATRGIGSIENVVGGFGNDVLIGNPKANILIGNPGNDKIDGGDGNDTVQGHDGNDTVLGGFGDDLLEGGLGNDSLNGGAGNDTYRFALGNLGRDTINEGGLNVARDVLDFSLFTGGINLDLSKSGVQNVSTGKLEIALTSPNGFEKVIGSVFNDFIRGGKANETILGGDGNDTIGGGAGINVLAGGGGLNMLDEIMDVNVVLTNVKLTGTGNSTLSGFGMARITGGNGSRRMDASAFSGNATLIGGAGNDTLIGGGGFDLLDGGSGIDSASAGIFDTVVNVEKLI